MPSGAGPSWPRASGRGSAATSCSPAAWFLAFSRSPGVEPPRSPPDPPPEESCRDGRPFRRYLTVSCSSVRRLLAHAPHPLCHAAPDGTCSPRLAGPHVLRNATARCPSRSAPRGPVGIGAWWAATRGRAISFSRSRPDTCPARSIVCSGATSRAKRSPRSPTPRPLPRQPGADGARRANGVGTWSRAPRRSPGRSVPAQFARRCTVKAGRMTGGNDHLPADRLKPHLVAENFVVLATPRPHHAVRARLTFAETPPSKSR
jgi:hypothetical protein